MPGKIVLVACEYLQREIATVLAAGDFQDVALRCFPAHCKANRRDSSFDFGSFIQRVGRAEEQLVLIGGACLKEHAPVLKSSSLAEVLVLDDCMGALISKSLLQSYWDARAYLLTPGWLKNWQTHLKAWGFEQDLARHFFHESTEKLILLDTGVGNDSPTQLRALADFLDLPCESVPIGLDYLELFLTRPIFSRRLEIQKADSDRAIQESYQKSADYAMSYDLIADVAEVHNEQLAWQKIVDLFSMLMAPSIIEFLPKDQPQPEAPAGRIAPDFPDHFCWTASGEGFWLKITHGDLLLGHLLIDGLKFPERKGHYVSLAVNISKVCGLSIYNARVYSELQRSRDLVCAADIAKSEFLANMSHEIRTPFNGIMGALQLVQMSPLDQEQSELIDICLESANRLLTLLNDILDLSKIESGKIALCEDEVDLKYLIHSLISLFKNTAEKKGIHLKSFIDDKLPSYLVGDETRIRQVLFNILGNALKFTEAGEVCISLHHLAQRVQDSQSYILITVEDTGIGIPEEMLDSIFLPFIQADGSHTRKYGGTGLGLTIVRKLVGLMGGSICIDSDVASGTTFYITLLLKPAASSEVICSASARLPQSQGGFDILVADDDAMSRTVLERLFKKLNHTCLSVDSGAKCLEALESAHFDVIFMDIQMPEIDGLQATRAIRTSGKPYASIPIIALTAHAMQGDRDRFIALGMDDYLAKPVDLEDIKRALEGVRARKI